VISVAYVLCKSLINSALGYTSCALDKLFGRLHNGEVLLLHPTSATNAAILDEFLTTLEGRGYTFGSLEELCAG
jgi:hypothetical protein